MTDPKTWERDGRRFSAQDVVSALKSLEGHDHLAWVSPDLAATIVRDFPDCAGEVITRLVYFLVDAEKGEARADEQLRIARARLKELLPATPPSRAKLHLALAEHPYETHCGKPVVTVLAADEPGEVTCRVCQPTMPHSVLGNSDRGPNLTDEEERN